MADTAIDITAGTGTPIRALTALGPGTAAQQVVTVADSAGNLLGTTAAPLPVKTQKSSTGTNSSVSGTVTNSTTLLASNANRLGATLYNNSTATLYVSLGATCTPTNFTTQIQPGGYFELPSFGASLYTGVITGVWAAATGNVQVTELT